MTPKRNPLRREERQLAQEAARKRFGERYAELVTSLVSGEQRPRNTAGVKRWWIVEPNVALGLPGVLSLYARKELKRRRRGNRIARASRRVNQNRRKA